MSKFQVGDKVRILNVDYIEYGNHHFNTGDVTEVTRLGTFRKNPFLKSTKGNDLDELYISSNELEYITKVDEPQSIFQRLNTLEKEVAELKKIVEGQKPSLKNTIRIEVDAKKIMESLAKQPPKHPFLPQSNNEKRATIIKKAKRELAEQLVFWNAYQNEFLINEEKRTVVLLRKNFEDGKVIKRGIAKCHPNDVFNEDIGKIIAFGRATGYPTKEYENAVQPDEVVVGMWTKWESIVEKGKFHSFCVARIGKAPEGWYGEGKAAYETTNPHKDWMPVNELKITNDTHAIY